PSVAPITPCFRQLRWRWNRRGAAAQRGVIPVCRRPLRRSSSIGVSGMPRCFVTICLPPSLYDRLQTMAGQGGGTRFPNATCAARPCLSLLSVRDSTHDPSVLSPCGSSPPRRVADRAGPLCQRALPRGGGRGGGTGQRL